MFYCPWHKYLKMCGTTCLGGIDSRTEVQAAVCVQDYFQWAGNVPLRPQIRIKWFIEYDIYQQFHNWEQMSSNQWFQTTAVPWTEQHYWYSGLLCNWNSDAPWCSSVYSEVICLRELEAGSSVPSCNFWSYFSGRCSVIMWCRFRMIISWSKALCYSIIWPSLRTLVRQVFHTSYGRACRYSGRIGVIVDNDEGR